MRRVTAWSAAVLSLVLALPARAEGAVDVIPCQFVSECDAAGKCTSVSHEITFTLTPVEVAPRGNGDWLIGYGGAEYEMKVRLPGDPWVWSEGLFDKQTVIFASRSSLIWIAQELSGEPTSTTRFLICEVG